MHPHIQSLGAGIMWMCSGVHTDIFSCRFWTYHLGMNSVLVFLPSYLCCLCFPLDVDSSLIFSQLWLKGIYIHTMLGASATQKSWSLPWNIQNQLCMSICHMSGTVLRSLHALSHLIFLTVLWEILWSYLLLRLSTATLQYLAQPRLWSTSFWKQAWMQPHSWKDGL